MAPDAEGGGEAHGVEDFAFHDLADARDDLLIEQCRRNGPAGILAQAVGEIFVKRGGGQRIGAEDFDLRMMAHGICVDDVKNRMAGEHGDDAGCLAGSAARGFQMQRDQRFALFCWGWLPGGLIRGNHTPFGAGDQLAHPGDAVGEIEEEPFAMRADSLDDLADAVEEEHVGLPAVFGNDDAFDRAAGEMFAEVIGERACLGAFHGGRVRGNWGLVNGKREGRLCDFMPQRLSS